MELCSNKHAGTIMIPTLLHPLIPRKMSGAALKVCALHQKHQNMSPTMMDSHGTYGHRSQTLAVEAIALAHPCFVALLSKVLLRGENRN